jgi:hypothetical protein
VSPRAHQGALVWATAVLVALAYGSWAVSLTPFSGKATAAIVGAGVAAILVGSCWRRQSPRDRRATGAGWWLALATVVAVWQLSAYLQGPRDEHPTLSSLANALLDTQPARTAAFVLWILGAIGLARR